MFRAIRSDRLRILLMTCILVLSYQVRSIAQGIFDTKLKLDTVGMSQLLYRARIADADSAIRIYKLVLQKCIEAKYPDGAGNALMDIGQKYLDKGKFQDGLNYFRQAFHWCLSSSNKEDIATCYNCIGLAYFYLGNYVQATDNYYTAIWELNKANKKVSLTGVDIYSNLAVINLRLKQNAQALNYFNEAEKIARNGNYNYQLAMVLINKGEYYLDQKMTDSARANFFEALDISKRMNKIYLQAYANEQIGKTFLSSEKYKEALPYLQLSIELAENRFNYVVIDASLALGEALLRLGNYNDAERILVENLRNAAAANLKDNTINGYMTLSEVYKAKGDYKNAMASLETASTLKDSLTSIEKTKAINQMEIKYQSSEKDKQLVQNQLLIAQQKNKIAKKNLWIAVIAGSIVLLILILLGIYRNTRHKQRLQTEQIRSLQQENRIGILKAIVHGEDNERQRIARELHDGIGGMISAVMMRFMTLRHNNRDLTRDPAYHEVIDMLEEMAHEVRQTAHNLMPEVLLKQSLPDALRSYCNHVQDGSSLTIDLQCYGSFHNISQDFKLNIYRILQELIKNILQHARASHALVQLQLYEQMLTITVEDNGIGFNTGQIQHGLGLHNLQTRIRSLDGNYTFESEPGKGTSVYMEFDMKSVALNETV